MNKKRIVFFDAVAPYEYDDISLNKKPQGGTESTVTRVAEGLAAKGHTVSVFQAKRHYPRIGKVSYLPINDIESEPKPDVAIALRIPESLKHLTRWGKKVQRVLWCHDYRPDLMVNGYPEFLKDSNVDIVTVSNWQTEQFRPHMRQAFGKLKGIKFHTIYNPIADNLVPDNTVRDPFKLLYFASPLKGYEATLRTFECLRTIDNRYNLYVANPGYDATKAASLPPGVVELGPIPHPEMIKHLRSAGCVLHVNTFPETFGIVFAEALATNTPLLTTDIGAAPEVIRNDEWIVPAEKIELEPGKFGYKVEPLLFANKILNWRTQEPPVTKVCGEYRLHRVINAWERLFDS